MRKFAISSIVGVIGARVVICLLLAEALVVGGLLFAVSIETDKTGGQTGEGANISLTPMKPEEISVPTAGPGNIVFLVEDFNPLETDGTTGWITACRGSDYSTFRSVTLMPDSSFVAVGWLNSLTDILSDNEDSGEFVIAKFDSNGDGAWFRNYGGSGEDQFYSVAPTLDGGFVAVGHSTSSDGDLSNNRGVTDFVIAKFDSNGDKVWIKNYGGSGWDSFSSVVPTPDGGFIVVGNSDSPDGDLPGNRGATDFVIAKFDSNGDKLWLKTYGGSIGDNFSFVAPTLDGGFVAVGSSGSSDGDLPGDGGNGNAVIARFDSNGDKVWIADCEGSDHDWFSSVAPTPDGGFVAVGNSRSSDDDFLDNRGNFDFFIAKFDSNGDKVWIKNYGGSGWDLFSSVVPTPDGGFVAVGNSDSPDGDLPGNRGGRDFVITRFDAEGDMVWIKNRGGSGLDAFSSVILTTDGGFLAAGSSDSSDGDLPGKRGYTDAIVAKFEA
jgi:hypothetical protein